MSEAGVTQKRDRCFVVTQCGWAGSAARFHQADRPRMATEHLADRRRPRRQCGTPGRIIDIAGNRPFRQARRALAPRGTLALVGVETGGRLTASRMLRAIAWSAVGRRRFRSVMPTERGEDIATVVRLAGTGEIIPQIDRVIGLADVPAALHDLAAGRNRGQVVARP